MENFIVGTSTVSAGTIDMFGVKIMLIRSRNGALGCGYINLAAAEKFGHALAIVSGVSTYDEMLEAKVNAVSSSAANLGVVNGMSGRDALELMDRE